LDNPPSAAVFYLLDMEIEEKFPTDRLGATQSPLNNRVASAKSARVSEQLPVGFIADPGTRSD
jgi:hypothetical protein